LGEPVWKKDARLICSPAWSWPAGQRRRIPGRNLLANLLHPHLAAGDAKAPDAVCALLRDSILKHLSGQFPQADEHAISDAFTTAFLDYLERPNSFDPACGELEAFLKQAARCDLRDLDRAARRRGQVELAWQKASYGAAPALLNGKPLALPDAGESPAEQVEKKEAAENLEKFLRKFTRQLDKQERIVFELQRHRRRKTALFAAALGIVHLPKTRQAREVKRIKDRLRFKLQTLLKKLEQNS
jgi:DNA-directed RNA polymerase specialized sigma24 family protein